MGVEENGDVVTLKMECFPGSTAGRDLVPHRAVRVAERTWLACSTSLSRDWSLSDLNIGPVKNASGWATTADCTAANCRCKGGKCYDVHAKDFGVELSFVGENGYRQL